MRIGEALRWAAGALSTASETPRRDAEWLMAHALGATRAEMLLHHLDALAPAEFAGLVARRLRHEPIAYIVGSAEFYGLELVVSPAVLIPRADSETLIDAAREALVDRPPARILDLGTGSGCLLLAALHLWPAADGVGVERSAAARGIAMANAARHAPTTRVIAGDWTREGWAAGLVAQAGRFDLVLANPPYVEADAILDSSVRDHEPAEALFAGPQGLDDYARLIPELAGLFAEGGLAVIEIGHTQAEAVSQMARAQGFAVRLHHDGAGRPRALALFPWRAATIG